MDRGREEVMKEKREKERKEIAKNRNLRHPSEIGKWFQILCFMNIPVFGFIYMLVRLIRKKTPEEQRYFAAAYLIYRVLVLLLAGTLIYVLYQVGLDFVDTILKYANRPA